MSSPTNGPISSARTRGNEEVTELIAMAVLRSDRVLLVAAGPSRWLREMGCTLVPLELPGGAMARPEALEQAGQEIGARWLRMPLRVRSSRWVYGPSQRHAVDRRPPLAEEAPAPLLHLSRIAPGMVGDEMTSVTGEAGLQSVLVRIFRAECAGLLELPFEVMRSVVRGMPLVEVVSAAGVRYLPAQDTQLPDDALLYLPAEYGERYLMRVVAKYGVEAIMQGEGPGVGHEVGQGELIDEPGF